MGPEGVPLEGAVPGTSDTMNCSPLTLTGRSMRRVSGSGSSSGLGG